MFLKLLHAGRYTHPQRSTQVTQGWFLSLTVSGCEYYRNTDPEGRVYLEQASGYRLALIPPGYTCDFCFNDKRENFVLICSIPALICDPAEEFLTLEHNNNLIRLRRFIQPDREQMLRYRTVFERVIELKNSLLPGNIFMAEALCVELCAELAVREEVHTAADVRISPGEMLKRALDKDENFALNLADHCRKLGFSPAYVRRCFTRLYGIEPQEYRLRRKFEKICLLLNDPELNSKEIAEAVGMKNITHLHAFIRQRSGMTVRQLAKMQRECSL